MFKSSVKKTGKKYRLPFEAEWEYAVRAGTTTQYFWGDNIKESNNYVGNSSKQTHPVGLNKPNQFGLYDMMGNVWEWTQDCWNQNYSGAPTDGSAWTSGDCSLRVLRGGSSGYFPLNLHTSYRSRLKWTPDLRQQFKWDTVTRNGVNHDRDKKAQRTPAGVQSQGRA